MKRYSVWMAVVGLLISVTGVRAVACTWNWPATGGDWTTASNNWNTAATPVGDSVNGPTNSSVFTNAVTAINLPVR